MGQNPWLAKMKERTMDPEIRWLLKTFPWIGVIATLGLGYITSVAAITQKIKIMNTRFMVEYRPEFITLESRPFDYYLLLTFFIVLTATFAGYTAFRIIKRSALIREDAGNKS